jgi:hypothetical protein
LPLQPSFPLHRRERNNIRVNRSKSSNKYTKRQYRTEEKIDPNQAIETQTEEMTIWLSPPEKR